MKTGPVMLLVGTRKGAFVLESDRERARFTLADPVFLGHIVNHVVLDPRDGRTIVVAARTGHLRTHDLPLRRSRALVAGGVATARLREGGRRAHGARPRARVLARAGHAREPGVLVGGIVAPGALPERRWRADVGRRRRIQRPPAPRHVVRARRRRRHARRLDDALDPDRSPRPAPHVRRDVGRRRVRDVDQGADWHPLNAGCAADFIPTPDPEFGHVRTASRCIRSSPIACINRTTAASIASIGPARAGRASATTCARRR